MEKIKKALSDDELHLFLIGENGYYCRGISDLNEPTDYAYAWENAIIPMQRDNSINLSVAIKDAFIKLLAYDKDINLALYTIVSHLNWYYYFSKKGSVSFRMDLDDFALLLKDKIREHQVLLEQDQRWGGAPYNSKNGLWGVFEYVSTYFKQKYDGIEFMPSDNSTSASSDN